MHDGVGLRVGDGQDGRSEARQVDATAVQRVHGVVRAGVRHHLGQALAARAIDHIPVRPLERRHVEQCAVGRECHAIAAAFELFLPEQPIRGQVDAAEPPDRAHIETAGPAVCRDPLDVLGRLAFRRRERRDAPDELVSLVDVEDQHADPAVLDVVPDAGLGDVEEASLAARTDAVSKRQRQRRGGCRQKISSSHPHVPMRLCNYAPKAGRHMLFTDRSRPPRGHQLKAPRSSGFRCLSAHPA